MLRITTSETGGVITLRVEGRLARETAAELEWTWAAACAQSPRVHIALADVTSVDAVGRALLARLHAAGAGLSASGCGTRRLLFEVTGREPDGCG